MQSKRIQVGNQTVGSESIDGLIKMTANRDIRVIRAQDVDQGRYICRSNDGIETKETETFVRFHSELLWNEIKNDESDESFLLMLPDYPFMEVSSKNLNIGDTFTVKCRVTNCEAQSAELSFMECPPSEKCTNKWMSVYPYGLNGEVVDTSSMDLLDTVTIIGRAKVSGLYKCKSTCYNSSFMKAIVVSDQAVIYNATEENVRVIEGENIYLFCLARTFSTLAVQWYKV